MHPILECDVSLYFVKLRRFIVFEIIVGISCHLGLDTKSRMDVDKSIGYIANIFQNLKVICTHSMLIPPLYDNGILYHLTRVYNLHNQLRCLPYLCASHRANGPPLVFYVFFVKLQMLLLPLPPIPSQLFYVFVPSSKYNKEATH